MKFFFAQIICTAFCFIFTNLQGQDLQQGLLVQYDFTGNYTDSSVNDLDGFNNGAQFIEDRFNNVNSAIYLDGVAYVEFPNSELLKPTFPFSTSTWVKLEELNDDSPVYDLCYEEDNYYGAWMNIFPQNSPRVGIAFGDGSGTTGPNSRRSIRAVNNVELDNWLHIVAIYSSPTEMFIYYNGCLQESTSSGSGSFNLVYSDSPGNIGRHDSDQNGPSGYFKGWIDDFAMWDRVITQDEIDLLYADFYGDDNELISYNGCIGDGFELHIGNNLFNENKPSGEVVLTNKYGCDSTVLINLVFNNLFEETITDGFCKGDNYVFNDSIYSLPGSYMQMYVNSSGCDSIYILELSEFVEEDQEETYFINPNESITINGIEYLQEGTYIQNLLSLNNCPYSLTVNILVNAVVECNVDCSIISSIGKEQIQIKSISNNLFEFLMSNEFEKVSYDLDSDDLLNLIVQLNLESLLGIDTRVFNAVYSNTIDFNLIDFGSSDKVAWDYFVKHSTNQSDSEIVNLISSLESKYVDILEQILSGGSLTIDLDRNVLGKR